MSLSGMGPQGAEMSGSLEHVVMAYLLDRKEPVSRAELDRNLANTSMDETLADLQRKGLIEKSATAEQPTYRPLMSAEKYGAIWVQEIADIFFDGDVRKLAVHMIKSPPEGQRKYLRESLARLLEFVAEENLV